MKKGGLTICKPIPRNMPPTLEHPSRNPQVRVVHVYDSVPLPKVIHDKRGLPARDISIARELDGLQPAAVYRGVPLPRGIILVCLPLELHNTGRVKRVIGVVVRLVHKQELAAVRAVVADPDAAEGFLCGRGVQVRVEGCVGGDLFPYGDAPDEGVGGVAADG